MNNLFILLQAQGGGGGSMLIWLILIFVVMWLLMVRPQQKQAKKEREFREKLKKGDRVSFSGGIYGKVHEVAEHTIDVEIANGVVVTVEKSMVQPIPEQPAANAKK
ncbi:MAG: preprotein translocase subunit YajC [Bacteroidales bacterium]|jgi:preprotein translocase subunit YajC|nr:preprotein translocase subunit YajC [Bacteroidales bacterium]